MRTLQKLSAGNAMHMLSLPERALYDATNALRERSGDYGYGLLVQWLDALMEQYRHHMAIADKSRLGDIQERLQQVESMHMALVRGIGQGFKG